MRRLTAITLLVTTVGLGAPLAVGAAPLAGPTLSGESFTGPSEITSFECREGALDYSMTYTSSGVATGPYPGTYTEVGRFERRVVRPGMELDELSATFKIVSGTTIITGRKSGGHADGAGCFESPTIPGCCAQVFVDGARYTATIQNARSRFNDKGTTGVLAQPAESGTPFRSDFASG